MCEPVMGISQSTVALNDVTTFPLVSVVCRLPNAILNQMLFFYRCAYSQSFHNELIGAGCFIMGTNQLLHFSVQVPTSHNNLPLKISFSFNFVKREKAS